MFTSLVHSERRMGNYNFGIKRRYSNPVLGTVTEVSLFNFT